MARIQFTPATKSKGFDPIQLSTASITRMREEADRVIQGMERNRAAELKQRTDDFQAMKDNQAYTDRITKENNAIELKNKQINLDAALSKIRTDQQQSEIDQQAMQSFFDLVKNVSKTAAAESAKNTAKQLENQTDNANAIELSTVIPPEKLIESDQAESSITKASIVNEQNIIENGVETGEPWIDTVKALATEAGLGHVGDKVFHNRLFDETQKIIMSKRLQSDEAIYDLGDGTKFSGIEASSDPDKLSIVQTATTRDVVKFMRKSFGITNSAYFNPGNKKVQERNATARTVATNKGIKFHDELIKEQVAGLMDSGSAQNMAKAFQTAKTRFGPKIAHDMLMEAALRGDDTQRAVLGNLDLNGNGKAYKDEWTNRYGPMMVSARKKFIDDQKFQDDFFAAKYRSFENENEAQIFASYDKDPEGTAQAMEKEAASFRTSVSKHFKDYHASIIRKTDEDSIAQIDDRFNKKALDLTFINNLPFKHREDAMELYDEQEKSKYGEDYEGIKGKFETTAKQMTTGKIDAQFGTSMTYLFQAEMEKRYDFHFKATQDATTALGLMMDEVNKGRTGEDPDNVFHRISAQGVNAFSFPNLEKGNIELLERVRDIDNNLKTKGAAVLDEAYLVSSEDEMDATYASSEIGVTNYSAGIYLVRDRLNANPAYKDNPLTLPEVFNRQRTANNLKSGRKAPLIMPNATQDSLASLPTNVLKLLEDNKPPMMKRRGQEMIKSHILGTPLPRRQRAYTSGNIGPTSTGPHLDVKRVDGGRFEPNALDNYVVVDDAEFGQVSLGKIRELTNNVGDSFDEHVARGSHGIDYGLNSGTEIYVTNGAKVVSSTPTEHGDYVIIELPTGDQYSFLHGKG